MRTHVRRRTELGRNDRPVVFFQFTLAGWGQFEIYGKPPRDLPPGTAFFAVVPSRHRYYLPESSPGWTFGWIGVYHPYLIARIARQVAETGAVLQLQPQPRIPAHKLRMEDLCTRAGTRRIDLQKKPCVSLGRTCL